MGLGGPQEYKPVGGNLIRETFMLMVESPFEYDQELFVQKNTIMTKRKLNLFNLYGQSQGRFLNFIKSYFFLLRVDIAKKTRTRPSVSLSGLKNERR